MSSHLIPGLLGVSLILQQRKLRPLGKEMPTLTFKLHPIGSYLRAEGAFRATPQKQQPPGQALLCVCRQGLPCSAGIVQALRPEKSEGCRICLARSSRRGPFFRQEEPGHEVCLQREVLVSAAVRPLCVPVPLVLCSRLCFLGTPLFRNLVLPQ